MLHWLIVLQDGSERRFRLDREESVLGQSGDCDIRIGDPTVSRRHARLRRDREGFVLEDLGSTNGSFVAGARVTQASVTAGTPLRFGSVDARIEARGRTDLAVALDLDNVASLPSPQRTRTRTGSASSRLLLAGLPHWLCQLRAGVAPGALARSVCTAIEAEFPGLSLGVEHDAAGLLAGEPTPADTAVEMCRPPLRFRWQADAAPTEFPELLDVLAALLSLAETGATGTATVTPAMAMPPEPASRDPHVRELYRLAARIAPARDIHVLIEGESGTGKELFAGYLHAASGAKGALLALNCAALPRDLLEAELFGIERGVATGVEARAGKFEQADSGTLFLDEIGDMAAEVQAKLLRVLQEGQVMRLGGRAPRRIDVRIVAATNRDLAQEVAHGRFRLDLYHRIADWAVQLPPLRERPSDLLNLAAHFLETECRKRGLASAGLSRDALQALRAYDWPGNVRELEREMRRVAMFLENGQVLDTSLLSERIRIAADAGHGRESAISEDTLREAIAAAAGNMSAAAQRLGVARSTLYRRMKALGIDIAG